MAKILCAECGKEILDDEFVVTPEGAFHCDPFDNCFLEYVYNNYANVNVNVTREEYLKQLEDQNMIEEYRKQKEHS